VVYAVDETDNTMSALVGRGRPNARVLEAMIGPHVAHRAIITGAGPFSAAALFARRIGRTFLATGSLTAERRNPASGKAAAYATRMKRWLKRFHGVATRYLSNYLAWHRTLEPAERRPERWSLTGLWAHGVDHQQLLRTEPHRPWAATGVSSGSPTALVWRKGPG
jgi:hypothetical protein